MASIPITIQALVEFTKLSTAKTYSEYLANLNIQTDILIQTRNISYIAGVDGFIPIVTNLPSQGEQFKSEIIKVAEAKIAQGDGLRELCVLNGCRYIKDNTTILIHANSRLVTLLLKTAANQKRNFRVLVTTAAPKNTGDAGIPAALIPDSAIGYMMEKVDCVIVGAKGVVKNGGLIGLMGTYPIAIAAQQANKSFYCIAERYSKIHTSNKFIDMFPLNQDDLSFECRFSFCDDDNSKQSLPACDYTPPQFVKLFFTNEGVLTPSGVAETYLKI